MSATVGEITMFRSELGISDDVMSDDVVNALWDETETDYTGSTPLVIRYAAYEKGIVYLVNRAANLADYEANEAREKLSQIAAQLEKRLAYYRQKVEAAQSDSALPAVQWGSTVRKPRRTHDWPNS